MKQVMKFVEASGKQRGVWVEGTGGKWDGATVTTLIWLFDSKEQYHNLLEP